MSFTNKLKNFGSQLQGIYVHEKLLFILVLTSAVKRTAATCEHTSPNPAMHVQWADRILPFCIIITQTFKDGNERLCECLIEAVNIYIPLVLNWVQQ